MGGDDAVEAVHVLVSGHVQGVGFRFFVQQAADARHLAGWVRNRRDGRVEGLLVGPADTVRFVLSQIRRGPAGARVDDVVTRPALAEEQTAATRPLAFRATA